MQNSHPCRCACGCSRLEIIPNEWLKEPDDPYQWLNHSFRLRYISLRHKCSDCKAGVHIPVVLK